MALTPSVVEDASTLPFIDDGLFGGFVNGVAGALISQTSQLSSISFPVTTIPQNEGKTFSTLTAHPPSCVSSAEGPAPVHST